MQFISVGYRISSDRAIQFRRWATKVLKEFSKKGCIIDRKIMENGTFFDEDYFETLLAEIRKIKLLKCRLVAGVQISSVESIYWWNNDINNSTEYLLEARTKEYLFKKIESKIKEIHPYIISEISYYEINGSKEFLN